jgi:hypothetical protein
MRVSNSSLKIKTKTALCPQLQTIKRYASYLKVILMKYNLINLKVNEQCNINQLSSCFIIIYRNTFIFSVIIFSTTTKKKDFHQLAELSSTKNDVTSKAI